MSPFSFDDYKKYLAEFIRETGGRGSKSALADAAGCQRSFFSQALHGNVHLTLEHALGISKYLGLSAAETEYFYCLVGLARSASPALSKYYQDKMTRLKRKGQNLAERLDHTSSTLKLENIAEYYSTWKYAAI